jgi:hypothetical protein
MVKAHRNHAATRPRKGHKEVSHSAADKVSACLRIGLNLKTVATTRKPQKTQNCVTLPAWKQRKAGPEQAEFPCAGRQDCHVDRRDKRVLPAALKSGRIVFAEVQKEEEDERGSAREKIQAVMQRWNGIQQGKHPPEPTPWVDRYANQQTRDTVQ